MQVIYVTVQLHRHQYRQYRDTIRFFIIALKFALLFLFVVHALSD